MTDMVKGFTVVLDKDIRIDDVKSIQNAIRAIRHVSDVKPVITTGNEFITQMRCESEFREKILALLKEI